MVSSWRINVNDGRSWTMYAREIWRGLWLGWVIFQAMAGESTRLLTSIQAHQALFKRQPVYRNLILMEDGFGTRYADGLRDL